MDPGKAKVEQEALDMARLLVSKKNHEILGATEFEIRDRVHRIGAHALEAALSERKKGIPRVISLFIEDVKQFLDEHEVRYSPYVEFTGKSGYLHRFDFLIPKLRKQPERLLKARC